MNILDRTGIYIAFPTTPVLKPIYHGYKTMVNNEHIKVGITERSFSSRRLEYQKTFNGEIEFCPIAIFKGTSMEELRAIEADMHAFLSKHFIKCERSKEWYATDNKKHVENLLRDHLKKHDSLEIIDDENAEYPVVISSNTKGDFKNYRWRPIKNSRLVLLINSRLIAGNKEGNLNHFEGVTLMLFEMLRFIFQSIFWTVKIATTLIMGAIQILYSLVKGIIMLSLTIVLGLAGILLAIVGVNVKAGMINYTINDFKKKDP